MRSPSAPLVRSCRGSLRPSLREWSGCEAPPTSATSPGNGAHRHAAVGRGITVAGDVGLESSTGPNVSVSSLVETEAPEVAGTIDATEGSADPEPQPQRTMTCESDPLSGQLSAIKRLSGYVTMRGTEIFSLPIKWNRR